MEIDVGLDAMLSPFDVDAQLTVAAARAGYSRIWTASGGDPFQTCALRWAETRNVVPGGIGTAIGVAPVAPRTPADLATSAAALSRLTTGRFILGIGTGSAHEAPYRRTWGIAERSSLALMRAYLTTMRGLLAGEPVTYHGSGIDYENARLPGGPERTPIYLGALGPEMIRLGGELADGIYPSWSTADQVSWTRERIAEGAARAHRDPTQVKLAASVRVCVDDDENVARQALAGSLLPYVIGWAGTPSRPFRTHFERMGFAPELAEIDRLNAGGAERRQIIEAFPERMLREMGYFGPAAGAAAAVRRLAGGADVAVVRIVPARPGVEAIHAILDACRPVPAVA
jgi:alkanesulfonate monooxygenase SsuD/methylene tetrahydromethanopterin reductase-like flavin-dependent oxidoreductase (luciferase family)